MGFRYHICDVFTEIRFGGNQLAVLPEATGLSDRQMQQVAREFNFAETSFVLPAEAGHERRVRIFTPTMEVPFAGHPNVGTAFVLATTGAFGEIHGERRITFEEKAGLVSIVIRREAGRPLWCELSAPNDLTLGPPLPPELLAGALSLSPADLLGATHPPRLASVGLPFLFAEVRDRATLARARASMPGLDALVAAGLVPDVYVHARGADGFDRFGRMFAPLDGVPEDPATGSASCALAGLLALAEPAASGAFRYRIAQGVEMGRPSILEARAEKQAGAVTGTWVGGSCVMVSEGVIEV